MTTIYGDTTFLKVTEKFGKIIRIYEAVLNDEELTTKHLTELGFSSKEIKSLVDEAVLEREQRGMYKFISIYGLKNYGLFCYKHFKTEGLSAKGREIKDRCIDKCYELDPKDPSICFQLFSRYVYKEQFWKLWDLLGVLIGDNKTPYEEINPCFVHDANYYLLFLSYLVKVPEKYKKYLNGMTMEDICVLKEDNRIVDKDAQNKIRRLVLEGRISEALPLQIEAVNDANQKNFKFQNDMILKLIRHIKADEKKLEGKIDPLLSEEKYDEIIDFITREYFERRLSDGIFLLLLLVKKGKAMKNKPNSILDAILADDYEDALRMIPEEERKQSTVYKMLTNIIATRNAKTGESTVTKPAVDEISANETTGPITINNFASGNMKPIANTRIVFKNYREQALDIIQELSTNHGIAILPPMDNNLTNEIKKMVYDARTFTWFDIMVDGSSRVVLVYKAEYPKIIDPPQLNFEAKAALEDGDFEKAIEKNLEIITNINGRIRADAFLKLARCYQRANQTQKALDCFLVYKHLSRNSQDKVDVDLQIKCLRSELSVIDGSSHIQINGLNGEEQPTAPQGPYLKLTHDS